MTTVQAVDGKQYLVSARRLVDELLNRYMPSENEEPCALHSAMRYSVMAGGKRLRPILALAAFEYCTGDTARGRQAIEFAMCALEMVHTYSLIHDDLPCMDNDDLRRGIPTCHKKFGEAVAVLAGDALHDVAFGLMARTGCAAVVTELAEALGTKGMLGGQMADVEAEGRQVTLEEVKGIHRRKTAALMRCAVRTGGILADADKATMEALSRYGEKLGLAFQIIDDILDIEGDQELLGKQPGSDCKNQKATYPAVTGLKQARCDAERLIDEATDQLDKYDDNMLAFIAKYIGQRRN
ncbi:MAG: polyprenyl synthetase family protein [Candidatus Zixiibacteriota bacterium]